LLAEVIPIRSFGCLIGQWLGLLAEAFQQHTEGFGPAGDFPFGLLQKLEQAIGLAHDIERPAEVKGSREMSKGTCDLLQLYGERFTGALFPQPAVGLSELLAEKLGIPAGLPSFRPAEPVHEVENRRAVLWLRRFPQGLAGLIGSVDDMPDDDPLGPTQVSGHGEHDERQRPEGVGDIQEDLCVLRNSFRTALEDRPEFLDGPPARDTYRLEFVGQALLERSEILVPLYLFGHKNEKPLRPKNSDDGFQEKVRRALPALPGVGDLLIWPLAEKGDGEHVPLSDQFIDRPCLAITDDPQWQDIDVFLQVSLFGIASKWIEAIKLRIRG